MGGQRPISVLSMHVVKRTCELQHVLTRQLRKRIDGRILDRHPAHQLSYLIDNIAHSPLLDKLATYPKLRRTIKGWLQAGVLADGDWHQRSGVARKVVSCRRCSR